MRRNPTKTPRSKVRAALRQLWLRSRERAAALKVAGYACTECGVKQSKAKGKEQKLEVHHMEGAQLDRVVDYIYNHLLCDPKCLEVLCIDCHKKIHRSEE